MLVELLSQTHARLNGCKINRQKNGNDTMIIFSVPPTAQIETLHLSGDARSSAVGELGYGRVRQHYLRFEDIYFWRRPAYVCPVRMSRSRMAFTVTGASG